MVLAGVLVALDGELLGRRGTVLERLGDVVAELEVGERRDRGLLGGVGDGLLEPTLVSVSSATGSPVSSSAGFSSAFGAGLPAAFLAVAFLAAGL